MRTGFPENGVQPADTIDAGPERGAWRRQWLAPVVIVVATATAYLNSFHGVFLLDDQAAILDNRTIRNLIPPRAVFNPPTQTTVAGRPILNVSLAVNYAFGGTSPLGYHVGNLAIHVICAILLFAVLNCLFRSPRLAGWCGSAALALALAIALLWALHPLQTMCVTYIVQRAESLTALFYLLTVYGLLRADGSRRPAVWYVTSVVACALGMGCKESMVTAPVMVLLVDGTFLNTSVWSALRRRAAYYGGLAATWLILVALVFPAPRSESAGLGFREITPLAYLCTQPGAILHYLRLMVWPQPLCLDYEWPVARSWTAVVPAASVVVGLLAAACWGVIRRRPWAFGLAAFFLLLAPTSSFVPIAIVVSEHRMYLPLAAALALVVLAGAACLRKLVPRAARPVAWVGVAAACIALGYATYLRNEDYRSVLGMWEVTVAQRPDNARARNAYGTALQTAGRLAEANEHLREAIRIRPDYIDAYYNLGVVQARQGELASASQMFAEVVRQRPDDFRAHYNYGRTLELSGGLADAITEYQAAVRVNAAFDLARVHLGVALAAAGRHAEAVAEYRQLLDSESTGAEAMHGLAWIEATHPDASLRNGEEAVRLAERVDELVRHRDPGVLDTLAAAYAEVGRFNDALVTAALAKTLADNMRDEELSRAIEGRMELYRQKRPYRESGRGGE